MPDFFNSVVRASAPGLKRMAFAFQHLKEKGKRKRRTDAGGPVLISRGLYVWCEKKGESTGRAGIGFPSFG
jgi:hypothetical protein